ncbi:MAG: glutamine-hydrolyzing carbamoyl-phosphate synthase small subunit [Spirochaetales bacterium]|nr:glutamine-hydrolyzing carbamoyl-phosphate synthase small subunit [Spirochaetales bacterium]
MKHMQKVYLVLEDASVYSGNSFGAPAPLPGDLEKNDPESMNTAAGEVVFNTSMTGYHEIITDLSYTGQIVMMTYPHIGNYGSMDAWSESLPDSRGTVSAAAAGLVVRDYYEGPILKGRRSLDDFMKEKGIPGISGIDTRRLTLDLRDHGTRNAVIVRAEGDKLSPGERESILRFLKKFPPMTGRNLLDSVGCGVISRDGHYEKADLGEVKKPDSADLHFALLDCGIKGNIVRELEKRGVQVSLLPSDTNLKQIEELGADALFLSNGPGDPGVLKKQIELTRQAIGKLPVYGICLGHQIISLALGAETYKMQFGHHGANHPVRNLETEHVFVTSQNHGFAVTREGLPEELKVWFINANDTSIEGIKHKELPVMSVQFHPEAAPGPHDGAWIFDSFISSAKESRAKK